MNKLILNFKSKETKKIKNPKNFLGGKGANLSEMGRMGLPVPPGFTISTEVCKLFYKDKKRLGKKIIEQIKKERHITERLFDLSINLSNNTLIAINYTTHSFSNLDTFYPSSWCKS